MGFTLKFSEPEKLMGGVDEPGIKKDGAGVFIEFTIAPLRDRTYQLIGLAAIMRDVTKRFEEMRALKDVR